MRHASRIIVPAVLIAGGFLLAQFAMPRVADGLGVTIVSTPRGVMSDHLAREQNVGGEVLCKVF